MKEEKASREMAAFLDDRFRWFQNEVVHRRASQNEFARWLGVKNTALSEWMNALRVPYGDNIIILGNKLGPRVYEILGIPPHMPDDKLLIQALDLMFKLPPKEREAAIAEFEKQMREKSQRKDAPAAGAA